MKFIDVLMETTRLSSPDAALTLARIGIPIFPCVANGKKPLTQSGFRDATFDIDQALQWWARWPNANIGMPTGDRSGVNVVDIDVAGTSSGFAAFERAALAGLADGAIAKVRTPSGGIHVYYPAGKPSDQRCWQSATAHIDFRGNGGYVIVPPSTLLVEKGRVPYRLFSVSSAAGHPIDAASFRRFIDPQSACPMRPGPSVSPEPSRLAQWVGRLQQGERNRGLFWAACRLAERGFASAAIEETLAPAAISAGLSELETAATIRSASRQTSRRTNMTDSRPRRDLEPTPDVSDAPCLP